MPITFAPGFTSEDYPSGLRDCSIDEQIQAFESMWKVWIFAFARTLVDMADSGFAVLTLLNAYPEMMAQLQGAGGNKADLYQTGMKLIFPELLDNLDDERVSRVCLHLYSYLRNALAHMGFTSIGIMLIGRLSESYRHLDCAG